MTSEDQLTRLKFPIGPFVAPQNTTAAELEELVKIVESAPDRYREMTANLAESDLAKTYREGSWNVRQLVNHVADIHLLHFFRMKKALTETDYREVTLINMDGWAHTADGVYSGIAESLDMFEAINRRLVFLMRSLDEKQLEIAYYHPVRKTMLNQKQAIAMSAWHVKHHLEHLRIALGR